MTTIQKLAYYAPRILASVLAIYITLFAFNPPMAVKQFIPTAILLVSLALSWRSDRMGILLYALLGIAYIAFISTRTDWAIAIAGPLFLCALLFGISLYANKQGVANK